MTQNVMIVNQGYADINPLLCGDERCEAGHSFGPASREYYLLHYVLSGKGTFERGGVAREVRRGQIFVIRPYEMTLYWADERDPWHYCWIGFESGLDLSGLLGEDVLDVPGAEYLFRAMRDCEALHSAKEMYLCGKIFELLALLRETRGGEREGPVPQYILKAKNYIESNYVESFSVGELARYLNLDRSYFSTAFRRHTGKSPQQYIVDFRLEKAAELLTVHGYRPGEAGQSVGYPDIYHFSRMFKRRYGVSPTQYAGREHREL